MVEKCDRSACGVFRAAISAKRDSAADWRGGGPIVVTVKFGRYGPHCGTYRGFIQNHELGENFVRPDGSGDNKLAISKDDEYCVYLRSF